jgi:GntR family transcriptional regulator
MEFNYSSNVPLYIQVADQIKEAILIGSFPEGQQVPSTTEISKNFNMNPATVLKGMNLLVTENILEKKRGIGMFVAYGALEKIKAEKKESFFADQIEELISDARKIGLTKNDVIYLIERGYNNVD